MVPLYERYNSLGQMLQGMSLRQPGKTAVLFRGEKTSYSELEALSNQVALALAKDGVRSGDLVALYCINSPWFVAAYFGVVKLGAGVVPINLLLSPHEVSYILADSDAKALIYFEAFEPVLASIRESVEGLPAKIVVGSPGNLGARPLTSIAQEEARNFEIPQVNQADHTAAVIYTSGTTGKPKGAMLTHRNLLHNVDSVGRALPVDSDDIFLTVLPLFHSFGATACMLTPLSVGATILAVPRFLPDEVGEAISKHRATVFMGVPSMYTLFANMRDDRTPDFSSLRFCVSGGAALPVEVLERFERKYGVPVLEGDGPTECSPVTSVNPYDRKRKPGSIGLPVPGVEMRIADEDGREVRTGEVGEIVVRGPNVMKGYYKRPEETVEAFFGEWYRTGDMGYVDSEGYFYIVDRKKDMIIVNGMNVYPRMVEEVLYRHPGVAEAAVVAEPHKLHGEVPRAVIVPRGEGTVTREEVLQLCRENLGRHEVPRIVDFVSELPKTPTGKILKRALVRTGEVERGVDMDES